jgi:hypothetical protein
MLDRVGGEFVQRKPDRFRGSRCHDAVGTGHLQAVRFAVDEGCKLTLCDFADGSALPIAQHQQVMRGSQPLQPRRKAFVKFLDRVRASTRLRRNRQDHGEQVLGAMGQLAHHEFGMLLGKLPVGDVSDHVNEAGGAAIGQPGDDLCAAGQPPHAAVRFHDPIFDRKPVLLVGKFIE